MRIGIDLGGTKIEGVVLESDGTIGERLRVPTPAGSYEESVAAIAGIVGELERRIGRRARVGVAHPGAISPGTGLIKNANSTRLNGRPLEADLERALGREVRLANDATWTGVGGGVVIDGKGLVGAQAIAGEWGHNPLPLPRDDERPGPTCYCGRAGCIETWLSGPRLSEQFAGRTSRDLRATEIAQAARAGDAEAAAQIELYCDRLARALAGVVNLLDPHAIVLGGGLSKIERLYERVPQLWSRYIFSEPERIATRLLPPKYGDSSGVRGAAWLWPEEEK
jgi:fructokinase